MIRSRTRNCSGEDLRSGCEWRVAGVPIDFANRRKLQRTPLIRIQVLYYNNLIIVELWKLTAVIPLKKSRLEVEQSPKTFSPMYFSGTNLYVLHTSNGPRWTLCKSEKLSAVK